MSGKKWCLLVAGSNSWDNYRHQANVCNAYQLLKKGGIPDEQIVVMMFDDIAYSVMNPYQGNVINQPNGPNIFPGVPVDYTGQDLTPNNFLSVLQGEQRLQKKVIRSTDKDNIFIYMTGLGKAKQFCFLQTFLGASDLIQATTSMKGQFKQMVIFMDCDYSGSLFTELSHLSNVYAVSACQPYQLNSANYYDNKRKTYLSDEFSAAWMNFVGQCDRSTATFQQMFQSVKVDVKEITPCESGNTDISKCALWNFL